MKHSKKNHNRAYERDILAWYEGTKPQPFDPAPFVLAARTQWADRPELVQSLALCTRQWAESELYTHLFDPAAIVRDQEWAYAGGLRLTCPGYGMLLVDTICHDDDDTRVQISGIEFLDKVMAPERHTKGFVIADSSGTAIEIPPMQAPMQVVWVK